MSRVSLILATVITAPVPCFGFIPAVVTPNWSPIQYPDPEAVIVKPVTLPPETVTLAAAPVPWPVILYNATPFVFESYPSPPIDIVGVPCIGAPTSSTTPIILSWSSSVMAPSLTFVPGTKSFALPTASLILTLTLRGKVLIALSGNIPALILRGSTGEL